jgi:hypothetical protein
LYIVNLIQYYAFFPYTMMHKRVYSLPSMCLRQISIARILFYPPNPIFVVLGQQDLGGRSLATG